MTVAPAVLLRSRTVAELRDALAAGSVSSAHLVEATLAWLDADGRQHNAVATTAADRARAEAAASDARRADGEPLGPLDGIPYGIKDVFTTAGVPTGWGAPPLDDAVDRAYGMDVDAAVVERLGTAGAVLAAKLAALQLAGAGGYRYPGASAQGPGLNPWDRTRWSGGSSSGSAIAVALGVLPFAIGTETTGSVVVPAAFCGVTGYRPSWGAVSQAGMLQVAWSVDKPGILARTAEDCRVVFDAIRGPDERDPTTRVVPPPAVSPETGLLGVIDDGALEDPTARERFEAALEVLRDCGYRLTAVELPREWHRSITTRIVSGETAVTQEGLVRHRAFERLLDGSQKENLKRALGAPTTEYAAASRERLAAVAELHALFARVDAIVAPTQGAEAPSITTDLEAWRPRRHHHGPLGALAGLPAISVPMGFGPSGMPLGLSIISEHLRDHVCLDIAERYQERTDWHRRRPEAPADDEPARSEADA